MVNWKNWHLNLTLGKSLQRSLLLNEGRVDKMRNWLVGLVLVGLLSVWGCQPPNKNTDVDTDETDETQETQETQQELKVAVAGPFTGTAAAFGEMIKRGAQLKSETDK